MGAASSTTIIPDDLLATNEFELVIKAAKELEWVLEDTFHATGKDLHGKIKSAATKCSELTPSLVRNMNELATIRHKLVYDRGFNNIAFSSSASSSSSIAASNKTTTSCSSTKSVSSPTTDSNMEDTTTMEQQQQLHRKKQFIQRFETSRAELKTVMAYYKRNGSTTGGSSLGSAAWRKSDKQQSSSQQQVSGSSGDCVCM